MNMKINSLLRSHMEEMLQTLPEKSFDIESDRELDLAVSELESYINLYVATVENISQNEVNLNAIVGGEIETEIKNQEGEVIGYVDTDMVPTIQEGDNLGTVVAGEIQRQEDQIFANGGGTLGYTSPDEFKEDADVTTSTVSVESIRLSPISNLKIHNEGLKDFLSKIFNAIKEAFKWIAARVKDFGHFVMNFIDHLFKTKDKLLEHFKKGEHNKKAVKSGSEWSDSTILTIMVDINSDLERASHLYMGAIAPYSKKFLETYKGGKVDKEKLQVIFKETKDAIIKSSSQGIGSELKKLGFQNAENYIMLTRPGQALVIDFDKELWTVKKEEISLDSKAKEQLVKSPNADQIWNSCIQMLNNIEWMKKTASKLRESLLSGTKEDEIFLRTWENNRSGLLGYKALLDFVKNMLKIRKGILSAFHIIPRSILSACKEVLKNVEFVGDMSLPALPKPGTESLYSTFDKSSRMLHGIYLENFGYVPTQEGFTVIHNGSLISTVEYKEPLKNNHLVGIAINGRMTCTDVLKYVKELDSKWSELTLKYHPIVTEFHDTMELNPLSERTKKEYDRISKDIRGDYESLIKSHIMPLEEIIRQTCEDLGIDLGRFDKMKEKADGDLYLFSLRVNDMGDVLVGYVHFDKKGGYYSPYEEVLPDHPTEVEKDMLIKYLPYVEEGYKNLKDKDDKITDYYPKIFKLANEFGENKGLFENGNIDYRLPLAPHFVELFFLIPNQGYCIPLLVKESEKDIFKEAREVIEKNEGLAQESRNAGISDKSKIVFKRNLK